GSSSARSVSRKSRSSSVIRIEGLSKIMVCTRMQMRPAFQNCQKRPRRRVSSKQQFKYQRHPPAPARPIAGCASIAWVSTYSIVASLPEVKQGELRNLPFRQREKFVFRGGTTGIG